MPPEPLKTISFLARAVKEKPTLSYQRKPLPTSCAGFLQERVEPPSLGRAS